jgi:hypothetical protein
MDGQKQRRALTAAEQALRALADGNGDAARRAIARAVELDQVQMFGEVAPLIDDAASEVHTGGGLTAERWRAIAGALGPGPLAAFAEQMSAEA